MATRLTPFAVLTRYDDEFWPDQTEVEERSGWPAPFEPLSKTGSQTTGG